MTTEMQGKIKGAIRYGDVVLQEDSESSCCRETVASVSVDLPDATSVCESAQKNTDKGRDEI